MKIYLIKHRGKTILQNLIAVDTSILEEEGNKCFAGQYFFRLKDAKKHLNTFGYKEFFEITSAEVKESKQDNRKRFN